MSTRGRHLLTAKEAAKLVAEGIPDRHRDGGSLFLVVRAPGQASWVYRFGPNNDEYAIGTWADVSLPEARAEHEQAREWYRQGLNPVAQRRLLRAQAAASTQMIFRELANEWLDTMKPKWSPVHYTKSRQAIERDVYPALGALPVASITPAMIHRSLEPLEARAPETWTRVRQHVGLIFDLARVKGLRDDNPVVKVAGGARSTGALNRKQPALLKLADLGAVLRNTEAANTTPVVRVALWLLSRTSVRPGELIPARWSEFDLEGKDPRWTIPRERMKTQSRQNDHAVPLSPAVVHRLKEWRRVAPKSHFAFPSTNARNKTGHIGVEALEKCYRVTLGLKGKHVPHGWRSAFNTLSHDAIDSKGKRRWDEDIVEVALDHVIGSKVRQAYDRGERWEARRLLMQWWSDQLDQAERGAEIVALSNAG